MKCKWLLWFTFFLGCNAVAGTRFHVGELVYWRESKDSHYIGKVKHVTEDGTLGVKRKKYNGSYCRGFVYAPQEHFNKVVVEVKPDDLIEYYDANDQFKRGRV